MKDVTEVADSMGLPGGQCGDTVYMYNTNEGTPSAQAWWNISALNVNTGETLWNLDTLKVLHGQSYAFVTAFACV